MSMDFLRLMINHDIEVTRYQLQICAALPESQWHHEFDFGQGSLYKTFDHLVDSKEYWTYLMQGNSGPFVPPLADPERTVDSIVRRFESSSVEFAAIATKLWKENRLAETFVDLETGPARRSYGACIYHVLSHSVHHRAQIFVMFDLLGVDYNPFACAAIDYHPLDAAD